MSASCSNHDRVDIDDREVFVHFAVAQLTFTSSLRLSLRFRLRRAISCRRIDSSSAVKTFFTWISAREH